MAIEIKSMDVKNEFEDVMVRLQQCFGWVLKSSQRVMSRDSHLENREGDLYSVTETVDFTKLVFERDTNMPHYQRLKDLECQYERIKSETPKTEPKFPSYISMEEWARNAQPVDRDLLNSRKNIDRNSIILGVVLAAAIITVMTIIDGFHIGTLLGSIVFGGIVGSVYSAVSYSVYWKRNDKAIESALKNPASKYRSRLEQLYTEVQKEAIFYERCIQTMQDIANEAASLVE